MLGWCILYLASIVTFGYGLALIILGNTRRSAAELAGLSLVLGAGGIGTILLLLSMLGIAPARSTILLLGLIGIAAIVISHVTRASRPCLDLPHGRDARVTVALSILPILGLLAANLLVMIPAVGMPLFEWDSFVIWGLKSKVLYHSALNPRPEYFTDLRFSFSHLDYPLMLPMLSAGAFAMVGQVNDQWGKIVLPVLFAGQTLLAYVGARLFLARLSALLVALLLIGAPFNVQFAGLGTADMALTTFRLASIVYLVRWIGNREQADMLLCALFSIFAAMTKSEGLPLAGINLLLITILAIRARAWRPLGVFILVTVVGIGIWLAWRSGLPHTDENYGSRLSLANLSHGAGRIGTILGAMLREFANVRDWGGIWLLVPILAIFGFGGFKKPQTLAIWALLLLHLGLYVIVYMITSWDVNELLKVTLPRLMLHILPAAMLVVAVHWGHLSSSSGEPG